MECVARAGKTPGECRSSIRCGVVLTRADNLRYGYTVITNQHPEWNAPFSIVVELIRYTNFPVYITRWEIEAYAVG